MAEGRDHDRDDHRDDEDHDHQLDEAEGTPGGLTVTRRGHESAPNGGNAVCSRACPPGRTLVLLSVFEPRQGLVSTFLQLTRYSAGPESPDQSSNDPYSRRTGPHDPHDPHGPGHSDTNQIPVFSRARASSFDP